LQVTFIFFALDVPVLLPRVPLRYGYYVHLHAVPPHWADFTAVAFTALPALFTFAILRSLRSPHLRVYAFTRFTLVGHFGCLDGGILPAFYGSSLRTLDAHLLRLRWVVHTPPYCLFLRVVTFRRHITTIYTFTFIRLRLHSILFGIPFTFTFTYTFNFIYARYDTFIFP